MSRWFRFHADAMRNPKVLRLSDKDFRLWINLLSIAAENGGVICGENDLKLMLGMRLDHLKGGLDRLIRGGLIDLLDGGYEPHGWSKYQYKSDTSTDRVEKHRAKRNVSVTPPETDTDTDNIPKGISESEDSPILKSKHVVEAWNLLAERKGLAQIKVVTPKRRKQLLARIRESTVDDFIAAMAAIERSKFLCGENERGWRADFDFLLQPKNFTKLIEGSYDQSANFSGRGYRDDEPQSPFMRAAVARERSGVDFAGSGFS